MEACSFWEHIYDAAAPSAASVALSHPRKTRIIAEASLKTDRVDSEALATLLRLDAVPEAFAPPPPLRELRNLVRERVFYSAKEKGVKNHLYSYMMRKGIPYEEGLLGLLRKREGLREHHSPVLDRGLDLLNHFHEATRGLDREIHAAFERSEEAKLLATIPGVGEVTAVTLGAYLCPIERFENIDQVSAYCGLCPATHQSGDSSYQATCVRMPIPCFGGYSPKRRGGLATSRSGGMWPGRGIAPLGAMGRARGPRPRPTNS